MTVFNTPFLSPILAFLSRLYLKMAGWKLQGQAPTCNKCVIIAAPHTSNWDFLLIITMAFAFKLRINWMGKDSLFKGPAGPIMRWMGGVAVDRSKSNNLVDAMVETYAQHDELKLAIPPEGTRGKVRQWKSGFYHIAHNAGVPISPSFLDFGNKKGGFFPNFITTGNYAEDLIKIQSLYQGMMGKNGPVSLDSE